MRITADTNVLVRTAVQDDPEQSQLAATTLRRAEAIAVTLVALCEFAWVLSRGYKRSATQIAQAIRRLIEAPTVTVDRPAVEAGLAVLEAGGDFADGVIAFDGRRMGGDVFVSFDRPAVALVRGTGQESRVLSP